MPSRINPVHALLCLVMAAITLAIIGQAAHHLPGGGRVLALCFLGGLFTVGFAACTLVVSALWPAQIERTRASLVATPLRCWLAGLLTVAVQIWIVLNSATLFPIAAAACLLLDVVWLAQGLPAVAALVGERLGADSRPRAVATGSVLFAATGILPVIGWLLGGTLLLQALGAALIPSQAATA